MSAAALQLPLPLSGDPEMTLEQLVLPQGLLKSLEAAATGHSGDNLWVSAGPGLGKTHALLALCAAADRAGRRSGYLAAADLAAAGPGCLGGLDGLEFVAVDDLHGLLSPEWQEAWFHRFNRWREQNCQMVYSAAEPVHRVQLDLVDLQSRLRAMTELRLPRPDTEALAEILRRRARARGMALSDDVVHYILRRHSRGPRRLLALLARLAEKSLIAQRRITVPFVREVLERA